MKNRKPTLAPVLDFAKARADKIHQDKGFPRGFFRALPAKTGDHVLIVWRNAEKKLGVLLTIDEADDFQREMMAAVLRARELRRNVHGLVVIGWCDASGEMADATRAQARIVEYLPHAVRVVTARDSAKRGAWRIPPSGLYGLDGWHQDRVKGQRGWKILSRIPKKRDPVCLHQDRE